MSKSRFNLYLSDHARAWAGETGNASAYISELLSLARADFLHSYGYLAARFSRPAIMAVMDVLNGHLFTVGMAADSEIRMSLDDSEEVRRKWGVSAEEWTRLLTMDLGSAMAFRCVAREFWAGRMLPGSGGRVEAQK